MLWEFTRGLGENQSTATVAQNALYRRVYLSTEQPYGARPKAGEVDPGGALKLGLSGAHFNEISGVLLGPASAVLGRALWGCSVDKVGKPF